MSIIIATFFLKILLLVILIDVIWKKSKILLGGNMRLSELMKKNNIQQQEMAEILKVSRASIYKYQQGKAEPSIESLVKIADYFDISLDYLCERQNKNLIFVDSLTETQKKLIEIIKQLTPEQASFALGYFSEMLKLPYSEVRPSRPF